MQTNGKKIKKVIFFTPMLDTGGMERVISDLSLNLPDSVESIIVLFADQTSYPYDFKGKIISLDLPSNNVLPLKIYYFFVGIIRLRKIIKKEKPDRVVSFGFQANIINIFSYKNNILRADVCLSSSLMNIDKFLVRILFNRAYQIICVSKAVAKDLIDNFKIKEDKVRVVYNPLSIKEISALAAEPLEPEYKNIFNSPVIINIGRIGRQKGQWYLIRAFKEAENEIKDVKLVILGVGKLESELKQLVKNLGLESKVYFLGWQRNPFKFLAKSKIFVLSSLWEGLPCVILEAMACKLPIISVDCKSGPREIIAPNTDIVKVAKDIGYEEYGILTPAFSGKKYGASDPLERSEKILKDAIVEVFRDQKIIEDLSKKSFKRANDFDISKVIKELF